MWSLAAPTRGLAAFAAGATVEVQDDLQANFLGPIHRAIDELDP